MAWVVPSLATTTWCHLPSLTAADEANDAFHTSLPAPPTQSYRSSRVPLAVLAPGRSTHRPEVGLSQVPLACGTHTWLVVLRQSQMSNAVPLAVPAPATSRHRPETGL